MAHRSHHNPVVENAKLILIFLVVLGHSIEAYRFTSPGLKALYSTIYSFHMPAFIIISGMLSRNTIDLPAFIKLIKKLLLPLLVFTLIYEAYHFLLFKSPSGYITSFNPYWILWYLISLFIWRVTLPLFRHIPALIIIGISIITSVLFALQNDISNILGLARTIHFWPFFLLGFFMTPRIIESAQFKKIPRLACLLFLALAFYLFWTFDDFNVRFFYGRLSFEDLGLSNMTGIQFKCLTYLGATLLTLAILRLTPETIPVPESWKKNTLYVYLWHGLPIKTSDAMGLQNLGETMPFILLLLYHLLCSILLVALLSTKTVKSLTNKFILQK